MPTSSPIYLALLFVFISLNLATDFLGEALNLVTLFNNPYALLTIIPVSLFFIGANSSKWVDLFPLLLVFCFIFIFVSLVKLPGSVPFYEGYVASAAILPFFILSYLQKKYRLLAILFVCLAVPFSFVSGQRITLLKVLLFFGIFTSLNLFKRNGFLKLSILLSASLFIFIMLYNLELFLGIFKSSVGGSSFDSDDTRSFLYAELFTDFKNWELLLGRGFLGTYFSDYFLMLMQNFDDTGDFYQRFSVEVGFLELILKGGFFYYFLYTIPLWYVALKSIFQYAHQTIPFSIGVFILIELLLMFFGNTPYFGFQFSLLFYLAGCAYRSIAIQETPFRNAVLMPDP